MTVGKVRKRYVGFQVVAETADRPSRIELAQWLIRERISVERGKRPDAMLLIYSQPTGMGIIRTTQTNLDEVRERMRGRNQTHDDGLVVRILIVSGTIKKVKTTLKLP